MRGISNAQAIAELRATHEREREARAVEHRTACETRVLEAARKWWLSCRDYNAPMVCAANLRDLNKAIQAWVGA